MKYTHDQLNELKEKIRRKKQAEESLRKIRELLEIELEMMHRQDLAVNKEYEDVLRMEGRSLASVFHSFLGNRAEKLDKEREEYLSARLKYEGHKATVAHLEDEVRRQEAQIEAFGSPESMLESLIQSRRELLKDRNDPHYLDIAGRVESAFAEIIEMGEAISFGEKASRGFSDAIQSMRKAKTWGTVDMLGGGPITTMVKHSHVDKARSQIQGIQFLLKRFKRELQDVKSMQNVNLTPDLSGFDRVIDLFFDNLIIDWVVQGRIHRSLDSLVATQQQIDVILLSMKIKNASLKKAYQSLKKEETDYLEEA